MFSSWTRSMLGAAIVFAALLTCVPAFSQTGGLEGKCIGQGGAPLAGYTILIERTDIKWNSKTKTNKKGEYTYIGLVSGQYKITLVGTDGKPMFYVSQHVGIGDPTEVNFDMGKAIEEAKKAQQANPEYQKQQAENKQVASLKQVFDQALALYNAKQYPEAAAIFEKALPLAKDKNVLVVMDRLADTWAKAASVETNPEVKKQDQAKALDYYNKLLPIDGSDAGLHNNLGSLYANMGKSTEAIAEFQKAVELNPAGAGGYYYNLGVTMYNLYKMDEAAAALKKCTDADPNNANAWFYYGMALISKADMKPDGTVTPAPGTIEAFQTYLKLEPNGPFAAQAQASIQSLQGKANVEYKAQKKKNH